MTECIYRSTYLITTAVSYLLRIYVCTFLFSLCSSKHTFLKRLVYLIFCDMATYSALENNFLKVLLVSVNLILIYMKKTLTDFCLTMCHKPTAAKAVAFDDFID